MGHVELIGMMRKAYNILVGSPDWKRLHENVNVIGI
jgi:hypothetical protein